MAGMQRVSWRSACSALVVCALVSAAVVGLIRRDGVHPTTLQSRTVTHWLLHRNADSTNDLVLADGLTSRIIARINPASETSDEVTVQGPAGAFLVGRDNGSVRAISTSSLQLGTAQLVTTLAVPGAKFGVGTAGLTVVAGGAAEVVAANDVSRPLEIPAGGSPLIAADGSVWLFTEGTATHVDVDESREEFTVPSGLSVADVTTVGSEAVWFDRANRMVRWLGDGAEVALSDIEGVTDAALQQPSDESGHVWLAVGDRVVKVGRDGFRESTISGLGARSQDVFAVSGAAAVLVRDGATRIERIDLAASSMPSDGGMAAPAGAQLTVSAAAGMIWIDDATGDSAWVVNPAGTVVIDKADTSAPLFDATGQVDGRGEEGSGDGGDGSGNGNGGPSSDVDRTDPNPAVDDPPAANPDSVTARAGATITVPVTANDFDPEGGAIAVSRIGRAGHGTTTNVDGSSVSYQPETAYSGTDEFEYTITDEAGNEATTTVSVRLFAPGSPNQPPLTQPDVVETRVGRSVTIDVLANDIDPERDVLTIPTFEQVTGATITDGVSQNGLVALQFDPPPNARAGGTLQFTYVAADPQGGVSAPTRVTVQIAAATTENRPPVANPDAARAPIGGTTTVPVMINDVDPDNDPLGVTLVRPLPVGVTASLSGNSIIVGLEPGAAARSVVLYDLTDGAGHHVQGRVLVLRVDGDVSNHAPIANPDVERVVVGNTVLVPVLRNDRDPDGDTLRLTGVTQPAAGAGKTEVQGDSVLFTPNLPDITQPTNVDFGYVIDDGHGNQVTGRATVTVLTNALPRAPFARDDAATTVTNKPVTIDVLANDSDPSGGRPALFDDPTCAGGTAQRTLDDKVLYTPPLDQTGTFRCKYVIANAQLLRREAFIVITVTPAVVGNTDPTLIRSALAQSTTSGRPLQITVAQVATDDDGDPLTFSVVGQPGQGGSTLLSATGTSLVYTPPTTSSPITDSFAIVVSDGTSTTRGQISVLVRPEPVQPPSAVAPRALDLSGATRIDVRRSFNVVAAAEAANAGMSVVLLGATLVGGSATVETNGASGIVSITPNSGEQVSVRYRLANAADTRLTAEATITVTVIVPTPLVPSVAVDDVLQLNSGDTVTVNVIANDSINLDPGESLVATLDQTLPAAVGTASLSRDGTQFTISVLQRAVSGTYTLKYTIDDGGSTSAAAIVVGVTACTDTPPTAVTGRGFTPYMQPFAIDLSAGLPANITIVPGSISGGGLSGPVGTYVPPAGMNDEVVITYQLTNRCGDEAPGSFTLDVNRDPRTTDASAVASVGSTTSIPLANIASDDEPVTASLIGAPSWVSLTADGISASPPGGTPHVPVSFAVAVTDPGGLSARANITIDVANRAPHAIGDSYATTQSSFSFSPADNDTDPDGDGLSVKDVAWVSGSGAISISGNVVTVAVAHGVSQLSYTITDGELTSTSTITITSNHAPTIEDASRTTDDGSTRVRLRVDDTDGDALVATCQSTTNLQVNVVGFQAFVEVLNGFLGVESFTCTVTDSLGASASATITIESVD